MIPIALPRSVSKDNVETQLFSQTAKMTLLKALCAVQTPTVVTVCHASMEDATTPEFKKKLSQCKVWCVPTTTNAMTQVLFAAKVFAYTPQDHTKVLNAVATFNATMDTCASVAPALKSALRTNLFVHYQLTAQPVTDVLAVFAVPHLVPTAKQTLNVLVARSALEVFAKTQQSKRLSSNDEIIHVNHKTYQN